MGCGMGAGMGACMGAMMAGMAAGGPAGGAGASGRKAAKAAESPRRSSGGAVSSSNTPGEAFSHEELQRRIAAADKPQRGYTSPSPSPTRPSVPAAFASERSKRSRDRGADSRRRSSRDAVDPPNGGDFEAADKEVPDKLVSKKADQAKQAALEIEAMVASGKMRESESNDLFKNGDRRREEGPKIMGVCIHWSGRGFGILRSSAHGETFVHCNALCNCRELVVGDVVTFEMGIDRKKQKPQAINCYRAGMGGYQAPPGITLPGGRSDALALMGPDSIDPAVAAVVADTAAAARRAAGAVPPPASLLSQPSQVDDAVIADAAKNAALKLLAGTGTEVAISARSPSGSSSGSRERGARKSSRARDRQRSPSHRAGRRNRRSRSRRRR